MKRLALIATLLAASIAGLATTANGDDSHTYYIELDNAFGLVNGSEVKVAGVQAGQITDFFINSEKRAVAKVELSGPVAVLGEDTVCSTEPQSLIAEYFIDCTPKGPPIEEGTGSDDDRSENPDIPVDQTTQTVQNDLVLSALREPFRDRLTLLINEFGTALAGNADNLNDAIRRGAPALQQTRQVFDLLARQNTMIRDLNVNSDKIIGKLAERRKDVVDFINEANATAQASSDRRDDLSQNFALLDDFLAELKPTMTDLNGLAVQGTPLLSNLRQAAPGLNKLSRNLPAFNASATDSIVSLGKSAEVGQRALDKGRDEIDLLGRAAKNSFSVADNLAKFLRDIDDPHRAVQTDRRANRDTGRKGPTGYTGMEGLLNYVYYQPGAINQYDEIGHLLHFSIFEVGTGPCANYNAGRYDSNGPAPGGSAPGVPNADNSGSTTDISQANRCVAWLGDSQPGINTGPDLPPYSSKVCPGGSDDTAICDPSSTLTAKVAKSGGKGGANPSGEIGPLTGPTGTPGSEGPTGTDGTSGAPDSSAPGDAAGDQPTSPPEGSGPDLGALGDLGGLGGGDGLDQGTSSVPRSKSPKRSAPSTGSAGATDDLLDYLFGT
jgi:ABC-type transporter Mla subunit MlaD